MQSLTPLQFKARVFAEARALIRMGAARPLCCGRMMRRLGFARYTCDHCRRHLLMGRPR